jgi:hypothetical protein
MLDLHVFTMHGPLRGAELLTDLGRSAFERVDGPA